MKKLSLPIRLAAAVVISVVIIETAVMFFLPMLHLGSEWAETLVDSSLLALALVPVLYAAFLRPMTAQLEALRESGARFRAITNSAYDAVIMMDPQGLISYWNPAAERMFGHASGEAVGRNLHELLTPRRHREAHLAAFPEFLRTGRGAAIGKTLDLEAIRKDGSEMPVALSLSAVKIHEEWHAVGIVRDTSEERAARKALVQARDAALSLSRAKAEFLANMSHEIRTPMNAVIGMTELLLDTDLTGQQREFAATIRGSGEALMAILSDILDFSKIESGMMTLEARHFSPRVLAEEVAMLFAVRAQDKGLEISAAVDEDLPPRLRADAGRMKQILSNFVSNAVKFTEKGEVSIRLSKLGELGDLLRLRLEVRDTGIGFDEAVRSRLFTAFTQADASTTRRYGGTGLGLAISKKLAELMGGDIGCESVPGKGSTFWLELTLQAGEAAAEAGVPEVEGVRVLVVDDNATNREIMMRETASWKMRPQAASDGPSALRELRDAAAAGDPFLVALIDMQMPGMDGAALARAIRGEPGLGGPKLILLSSMGTSFGRDRLIEKGFDASLAKPVRKSLLFDCISEVLSAHPSCRLSAAAPKAVEPRPSWGSLRILVAEDNPVNQKVALLLLRKLGCKADVAANGREAVEAAAAVPYDLVLMDCQMPEMDGFEATAVIRKRLASAGRKTVIIAMTANALEGDRERCLAAGMDDYVSKPMRAEDLAAAIDRWYGAVDAAAFGELRKSCGEDDLRALVEQFLADADARLEALRAAARGADADALGKQAHSLKGSASNLGAQRVSALAARLQAMGRERKLDGAAELVEELGRELAEASKRLREVSAPK